MPCDASTVRSAALLKYNLRSVKAHLMREDFNRFWPGPLAKRARPEHGPASFCVSVEGFTNKAKLTMRKAYGFKTFENIQIALFHQLGKLPEPKSTHKFC